MSEIESIWDYRSPHEWMRKTRTSSMPPLIVVCAITGGIQGKEANPDLPETPKEQAESTYEAYKAGASVVHVHARDPKAWYNSSGSAEVYRDVNGRIRELCPDIVINNTTGGSPGMTNEERLKCLDAMPEMATLNMGPDMFKLQYKERPASLPSPRAAFMCDECTATAYKDVALFAREMKKRGVKPEMELYNTGMYWVVEDLQKQGLIEAPYVIQFVTGYPTGTYPTPDNLMGWVRDLPQGSLFFVAGLGPYQIPMNVMGILLGGHVRVGMEDNVYYKRGQLLKSNAEAVERVVRLARDMNREIATPAQAREMMGLSQKPNQFN